jgi:hypothetical protein
VIRAGIYLKIIKGTRGIESEEPSPAANDAILTISRGLNMIKKSSFAKVNEGCFS